MTALQRVKKAINLGYNNLGREKLDWVRKSSILVDVIAWPSKVNAKKWIWDEKFAFWSHGRFFLFTITFNIKIIMQR